MARELSRHIRPKNKKLAESVLDSFLEGNCTEDDAFPNVFKALILNNEIPLIIGALSFIYENYDLSETNKREVCVCLCDAYVMFKTAIRESERNKREKIKYNVTTREQMAELKALEKALNGLSIGTKCCLFRVFENGDFNLKAPRKNDSQIYLARALLTLKQVANEAISVTKTTRKHRPPENVDRLFFLQKLTRIYHDFIFQLAPIGSLTFSATHNADFFQFISSIYNCLEIEEGDLRADIKKELKNFTP